jgi:hypothetical protein
MGVQGMTKKKTIKQIVLGEIFEIWDNEGVEFARDKLKKLYLSKYDSLIDIEEKRLILHNLTVTEIEIGLEKGLKVHEMSQVKFYSSILKNDMDNVKGYKEGESGCLYVRVLINYIASHKKEMSKEELIEAYGLCYSIYEKSEDKNDNGHLNKLIAKFNLNLVKENFTIVLEVLEDVLHNDDTEYQKKLYEMIQDVKETNSLLYGRVSLLLKQNKKSQVV